MRRKDAGFAEKLLPVLLSTGMVFGMVLLSGQFMQVLRIREQMSQIARAYMLEMETTGYLTGTRRASLKKALEEEGLTEINLVGTTAEPVGYGDSIQLIVEGVLSMDLHVAIPFLSEDSRDWVIPIKMRLYSTAKH